MTASGAPLDVAAARRTLEELRQLERELVERDELQRHDALERVRDAVRRIGEVGSPEGILDRAAEELGASSRFERVLISEVRDGRIATRGLWVHGDPGAARRALEQLAAEPIPLDYPLVEQEVAKRQQAAIVDASGPRAPRQLASALDWREYVVTALTLHGATVGMLHADVPGGRPLGALDRDVASLFAEGLAGAFERAALRSTLRRHREELGGAVRWMSGRLERLATGMDVAPPPPAGDAGGADAGDRLTPREAQVMRLLAEGKTNREIAAALVVGEGTVKYHVKNILRKLHATSRADAVARHLRDGG